MNQIEHMKWVNMIQPQLKDNGAPTGITSVDTKDWEHLRVMIHTGATDAATTAAPQVQESDTLASGYTDITAAVLADAIGATEDNAFFAIDVDLTADHKRYMKLLITAGDGTTGTNLSVHGILSKRSGGFHDGLATKAGLTELISA